MITRGELPETELCCECGATTGQVMWFRVQCETAWSGESSDSEAIAMAVFGWIAALASMLSPRAGYQSPEIHGREVAVSVPLNWCENCVQSDDRRVSMRAARKLMKRIPVYAELFQEYPRATLELLDSRPETDTVS